MSSFYTPEQFTRPELAASAARGRLGSALNSVYIDKIVIRVISKPPALVYRRPFTVDRFDGMQQDKTVDRIMEAFDRSIDKSGKQRGGHMTRGVFAGVAGGYLRPSVMPQSLIDVPDTSYAVAWIYIGSKGMNHSYELVCVTFDTDAIKMVNGEVVGIEEAAVITVNNVIELRTVHEDYGNGNFREVHNFRHSSNLVYDPEFVNYRTPGSLLLQTPETCIQQAQSNRVAAVHGNDRVAKAASTFITSQPKPAPTAYNVPAAFIADAANAYVNAASMNDDAYVRGIEGNGFDDYDDPEDLREVNNMSAAARLLGHNPFKDRSFRFQSALAEVNGGVGGDGRSGLSGGTFRWRELLEIEPRFRYFTSSEAERDVQVYIPRGNAGRSSVKVEQRFSDDTPWSGTGEMHSAAMMLGNMTLAVMFELGIAAAAFMVTNETTSGRFLSELQRGDALAFISTVDNFKATDAFLTRIETEIAPECAATGDGHYHDMTAHVEADVSGAVFITMSMDGASPVQYPLDSPFSNGWTPLVTGSAPSLASIAATVSAVFEGAHVRRQRESISMLKTSTRLSDTDWQ